MGPQRMSVNQIIKQIRARIVRRRVLQGVAITLAVAAVSLISASILANKFSHKQALLMALRILPIVLTFATAWWFVFRALRRKISDAQIARLVEEKISFDDRVTTAVEFGEQTRDASPAIVNRLVRDADERVSDADLNKVVDPRHAYAYGAAALAILIALIASLWWLAPVKGGVSALYAPDGDTVSANAMFINVTPPTSRVPRGSDQKLKAALNGFDTNVAQVFIRKLSDANWLATPMEPAKNKNEFQHVIFNIQDSVVYYVEANGIRSSEQTLEVVDLPYVKQIDLILNFPAFTGMAAKKIENGGDVAALKGTVVRVTAILSAKAKAAQIILSDGSKIPMTPDFEMTADNEFHFVGQFTVKEAGTYKIELTSEDGERYNGSNEYDITLLEDAPPSVVIDKPGRDMKVTNIQEVFTQAKAEDDFGVSSIEFFYMVNGGEEKRVTLQDLKRDEPKTLSGAHTFFLEEMSLQVGDFISYYAKAKDVTGQESTSDIYFLEVRPFDREFRQSQQQGAPGGQGEQESNALTKKQREIIAATFRVQREEKQYTPPELEENFGAVALSQEKLKGEAEALVDRIRRRLGDRLNSDPQFSKLVEYISNAATEMGAAKDKLRDKSTREALPPEQRALQQLLKAEALNREIQVGQQSAQGGGGGGQQDQKDLADLFELQLDKMKNQYETVQRQQQQAQSQQQDELARKLQELAQRQQKELEQRMRSQMQQQGGGGGGQQRQQQEMIEEAQRMARELERLSRDRRDPKMQQAAEQMRQAAEEMKRAQSLSSASQSPAAQAEAAAQTQRALQRMEQARRMLNSSQQAGGQQNVQQLRQRAEEAMRRQGDISKSVEELAKNGQAGASGDKKQQLSERKQALAEQLSGLEKDIDQAARGLGTDKQQAADKLRDAANAIRRNRIPDRIKQNNQLIDNGYFAQAGEREKIIKDNIEEVVKNLQAAESGANRPKGEGMEEALSRARELTENLESMRKKMEQGGAGSQENQGQNQSGQQQNGRQNGQQQAGQQNGQQGQQANQQGRQNQSGQQGSQQGGQQSRNQNGQQAGNQQNGQQQGGQQRGSQRGQQQGGQQSGQQSRGQQQGQQSGGQQSGQQPGGQQQGGQQSQQGQQGQQGGGQQQGGQQGQQGGQRGQQGGQQQGGQQSGGQQGGRQSDQQSGQPGQQSAERQMFGGGGPPRTGGDRQSASELQQRLSEAQELRRALRGNNDLMRDLDKAIDQLRRINPNAFDDPAQMALLKSEVIDPLRQLEVELARRLQGKLDNNGIGSLSDGDAPDRYRKLIEEYYRRLSSRSAGTKP
jgi:hypothetical protein